MTLQSSEFDALWYQALVAGRKLQMESVRFWAAAEAEVAMWRARSCLFLIKVEIQ